MIEYVCDGCATRLEHAGPDIPEGWAAISVQIRWSKGSGNTHCCEEWENDNEKLLCHSCRGPDAQKLLERAESAVSKFIDHRPKAAPR